MTGLGSGDPVVSVDDGRVVIPVATGPATLPDVAARLAASGLHVTDLVLRRPSLDDVFLALTGQPAAKPSTSDTVMSGGLR